jgi:hypothetical protein
MAVSTWTGLPMSWTVISVRYKPIRAFDVPWTVLSRRAARLLGGADVHEAKGHAAGDSLVHRPRSGVDCGLGAVDANNHRL